MSAIINKAVSTAFTLGTRKVHDHIADRAEEAVHKAEARGEKPPKTAALVKKHRNHTTNVANVLGSVAATSFL
jgi:hypothetical protein